MLKRFHEFFEENLVLSMARFCTFVAIIALTIAMFFCLATSGIAIAGNGAEAANLMREGFAAATEFGLMVCGLGGFNYASNRGASAYQSVRISQAEQGIQPAATPSSVTINTGGNGATKAKDMNVTAEGDVNVEKSTK